MHRFTTRFIAAGLAVCVLIGCGGGGTSPSRPPVQPPHGGHLFAFPENRGFVEIKTDRESGSRDSRAPAANARILAYFYERDGSTAMSPPPSDVRVQIGIEDKSTVVTLAPQPREAGSFASDPGIYPEGLRGQIEAKVDGAAVKVPFLFR